MQREFPHPAPKRPRRMLGVAIILASFGLGWVLLDIQTFLRAPLTGVEAPHTYVVEPGTGLIAVARDLAGRGYIKRPRYLVWSARLRGTADRIVAGEYQLAPGMTAHGLLERLVAGEVILHALTIPEGWTFRQLLASLHRNAKVMRTLDEGLTDEEIMAALGLPGEHPEGQFFPDTYRFAAGTTDIALLNRAREAMQRELQLAWEARAPGTPLADPYEALILASIIEKETGVAEERGRIAGVFTRRLQMKMRLQTDPTVIYGIGAEFDGRLRYRHLRTDTPYNTYTRAGLPPTPIALPGAESLRAAVNPEPGDEIFFVSRGDGTHYFSVTLDEHNAAVRKYQLGER